MDRRASRSERAYDPEATPRICDGADSESSGMYRADTGWA